MNPKKLFRVVSLTTMLASAPVVLHSAEASIELAGLMKNGKEVRFVLKTAAGATSSWLAIGQTFEGYTVQRFEEDTETVTATKEGKEVRLRLTPSKVISGGTELPPEIKKKILNNLRQLSAAADQYFLVRGVVSPSYDDLVGPRKYVKEIVVVDGEDYRSIKFSRGQEIQVKTREGYTVSYLP